MKKYLLETVVFISGAIVMIYEIVGSRVLGPYLGTSIFIWTSLIGIILGSLSLGYYLGGRIADKKPTLITLAWIIFFGGLMIGISTLIKDSVLVRLPRFIPGLKMQSVVAAILLFAPASVLLGMVSPYAVRLKMKNLQSSGRTVGNLYAISTVGSIVGTFAAGFFLIPQFGSTNILWFMSGILALIAILLFFATGKSSQTILPGIFILGVAFLAASFNMKEHDYIDTDTQYNRVLIYDGEDYWSGRGVKFMRINNERSSAMFLDDPIDLVYDYSKYYLLADHFRKNISSALIIGGAAYSFPKYFLHRYPDAKLDVVEIDPGLTILAREHFHLKDDPRLDIVHEDGRTFLNRTKNKYDVIYGDAFKSLYTLPWHLTTIEAVQASYDALNEGGVVAVNIISSISGSSSNFLSAELATYRAVFPIVRIYAAQDPADQELIQSTVLIAVKSDKMFHDQDSDPELDKYLKHDVTNLISDHLPILTDDHAPVDYYTNAAI